MTNEADERRLRDLETRLARIKSLQLRIAKLNEENIEEVVRLLEQRIQEFKR